MLNEIYLQITFIVIILNNYKIVCEIGNCIQTQSIISQAANL